MEAPTTEDSNNPLRIEVVFDNRKYSIGQFHLAFKKLYEAVMEKPFPLRPAKLGRRKAPEAIIQHAARNMDNEICDENE